MNPKPKANPKCKPNPHPLNCQLPTPNPHPNPHRPGDTVMLSEWGSQTVKINDEDLHIVKEEDILGILELDK